MREKLSIAMVVNFLPDEGKHGGVSYQVHSLANRLHEYFDVTIFAMNETTLNYHYKNVVVRFPGFLTRNRFFTITLFPLFVRFQNLNKFDIIHTHGEDYLFFFLRKPIIRTFYGSALGELKSSFSFKRKLHQFFRYFFEYLSGFHAKFNVAISHSTKKYLPFIDEVIPCGIDLEKFKPGNGKSSYPSILFVGTIKGRKRGWFLVKVFEEEIKQKVPDAELWIVSSEEVYGDGIRWFGHVFERKLIELYQTAWVFCLPSLYEGFGVPYIEAMACGTTVVSSPNSGAKEVLENGKYGLISGDEAIGKTVIGLLRNQRTRDNYVHKGLKRAQEFSWDNVTKEYRKLYSALLKVKRKCNKVNFDEA